MEHAPPSVSFPLYQGFFPQLVLGVDELLAYRRLAKERVAQLVRVVEDADCIYTWSAVKRPPGSGGAKCLRASAVDVRPDSKAARAATLLKASVQLVDARPEEVLAALARSRTKDMRRALAFLHGDAFLDAQTLLTFPTASDANKPAYAYRAIKWCALKSRRSRNSSGSNSSGSSSSSADAGDAMKHWKGLDFCYLEYAGRKKPRPGSSVLGFIVQEAIGPDREVPHLDAYGLTRAPLSRSGIVITRTHQSNIIQVTAICQIDGALPAPLRAAMEDVLLESVASISRVKGLLERQRLGRLQYLEQWEWVARADRKACAVCLRGFYFHRKHHCQTCGEVVCSSCAPLRELEEPILDATQIRVCTLCLAGAAAGASVAAGASTDRSSSNGGTDAYMRELQQNPRQRASLPELTRHRPSRLLEEGDVEERGLHPSTLRTSDLSFGGRPQPSTTGAKAEALSKLAYHMQQLRETISVAASEADDDVYEKILRIRDTLEISSPEFDAVLAAIGGSSAGTRSDVGGSEDYYRYGSSSGGGGGGSGSGARSSHSSRSSHGDNALFFSDDHLSSSSLSSLSQSSRGSYSVSRSSRSGREAPRDRSAAAAAALQEESARYYRPHDSRSSSGRGRRSPAHKDSLFSDQTAASSASKQSSEGKLHHHPLRAQLRSEHVVTLDNTRGIHRLAQKIEKLQQRLEDAHRAASVVSSSDLELESEPEPEAAAPAQQLMQQHQLRHGQYNRTRRSSYVETKRPAAPSSSAASAHATSQMVQALRGVMESSELTPAPPAWRRSFSSAYATSNEASSSSASSSSRLSAASLAAHARSHRGVLPPRASAGGRHSSGGGSSAYPPGTTLFVYDEDSVNKLQRLSIERRAVAPEVEETEELASDLDSDSDYDGEREGEHECADEEFSISSSEDDGFGPPASSFVVARRRRSLLPGSGRDAEEKDGRLRHMHPPSLSSLEDSLGEGDDNVASLPSTPPDLLVYEWSGKQPQQPSQSQDLDDDSDSDATRRLVEDVSKLPARMRTSSGQSSGAPSQENHDF